MSGAALFPGRNYLGQNYPGFAPAGGISPTYPTTHAVYFKTTAITLTWGLVSQVNAYQLEVSTTPDFSGTLLINVAGLTVHSYSFTDTGTNDSKRWWRWRYSYDGGTSYNRWSEVGSYWVNTSGAQNINLSRNIWGLINPSPVTDKYLLQDFPLYGIVKSHLYRVRERNRLGTLLSEYITMKETIQFDYTTECYLGADGFFELRRFNEEVKTFFLATFKSTSFLTPTPNIWKVQFDSDPALSMLTSGRQDLYVGTLNFMEV